MKSKCFFQRDFRFLSLSFTFILLFSWASIFYFLLVRVRKTWFVATNTAGKRPTSGEKYQLVSCNTVSNSGHWLGRNKQVMAFFRCRPTFLQHVGCKKAIRKNQYVFMKCFVCFAVLAQHRIMQTWILIAQQAAVWYLHGGKYGSSLAVMVAGCTGEPCLWTVIPNQDERLRGWWWRRGGPHWWDERGDVALTKDECLVLSGWQPQ